MKSWLFLVLLVLVPCALAYDSLNDNLTAYWSLNGNFNDATGHGYNAAGNNPDSTTGHLGVANTAYDFEYVNADYLDTGLAYIQNRSFSIAMWYTGENYSGFHNIMGWGHSTSQNPGGFNTVATSGYLRFYLQTQGGTTQAIVNNKSISFNQWTFVVGTYNQTTRLMKLYVNGTYVGSIVKVNGWKRGGSYDYGTFNLGRYGDYAGLYHDGKIDETGVWWRVLTQDDVTWLWNSGTGRTYAEISAPPTTIDVNLTAPIDDIHLNAVNVSLNWTTYSNLAQLNCTLQLNLSGFPTVYKNYLNTANGSMIYSNTSLTGGAYTWGVNCSGGSKTDYSLMEGFIIDRINPIYTEQHLSIINDTFLVNREWNLQNFSGYWYDKYMFGWNHTIAKIGGTTYYTNQTDGLTGTVEWVNKTINIASWPSGWYYSNHTGRDDHTLGNITEYNYTITPQYIEYRPPSGNIIRIGAVEGNLHGITTAYMGDRYTFNFTWQSARFEHQFDLTCDETLYYRGELYDWPTFVCGEHWLDFVPGNYNHSDFEEIVVTRHAFNRYNVNFKTYERETHFAFNSLGGLNTGFRAFKFKIDYQPLVNATLPVNNYASRNYSANITYFLNDTDSTNINCSLRLNGAFKKNSYGLSTGTQRMNISALPQGNNTYTINCSDAVTETTTPTKYLYIDRTKPLYDERMLYEDNSSSYAKTVGVIYLGGNWSDNLYLGRANLSVINGSGTVYYHFSTILKNSSYLMNRSVNTAGWKLGEYRVRNVAYDWQTYNIDEYNYNFTIINNVTRYFYQAMMTVRKLP